MENPDMTQPEHCNARLYATYTILAYDIGEVNDFTKKALESQARELQATVPEVIASWLNEMAELHR